MRCDNVDKSSILESSTRLASYCVHYCESEGGNYEARRFMVVRFTTGHLYTPAPTSAS